MTTTSASLRASLTRFPPPLGRVARRSQATHHDEWIAILTHSLLTMEWSPGWGIACVACHVIHSEPRMQELNERLDRRREHGSHYLRTLIMNMKQHKRDGSDEPSLRCLGHSAQYDQWT